MKQALRGINYEFLAKLEEGIQKSYEQLVRTEAAKGGSLIYYVDGKITEVPAVDLLKGIDEAPDAISIQ